MNIREINNKNFTINISIGNDKVDSVNDYLNEFEKLLSEKLSQIFDKNLPFIETEDKIVSFVPIKIFVEIRLEF